MAAPGTVPSVALTKSSTTAAGDSSSSGAAGSVGCGVAGSVGCGAAGSVGWGVAVGLTATWVGEATPGVGGGAACPRCQRNTPPAATSRQMNSAPPARRAMRSVGRPLDGAEGGVEAARGAGVVPGEDSGDGGRSGCWGVGAACCRLTGFPHHSQKRLSGGRGCWQCSQCCECVLILFFLSITCSSSTTGAEAESIHHDSFEGEPHPPTGVDTPQ